MKHKSTKTIQNRSTASILCPIFNFSITTTISIMNSSPHCISHHLGIQSLESAGGVCKQNTLAFLVYESGEARFSVWTRPIPKQLQGVLSLTQKKIAAVWDTHHLHLPSIHFQGWAASFREGKFASRVVNKLFAIGYQKRFIWYISIHNWFCSATDVDQMTSTEMRLLWYRMSPHPVWWKVNIYRDLFKPVTILATLKVDGVDIF